MKLKKQEAILGRFVHTTRNMLSKQYPDLEIYFKRVRQGRRFKIQVCFVLSRTKVFSIDDHSSLAHIRGVFQALDIHPIELHSLRRGRSIAIEDFGFIYGPAQKGLTLTCYVHAFDDGTEEVFKNLDASLPELPPTVQSPVVVWVT